jgi:hypothetical protein
VEKTTATGKKRGTKEKNKNKKGTVMVFFVGLFGGDVR